MLKRVVGSGQYAIAVGSGQLLEAHLGTCVGVTICDRTAGIGGLCHLLLPEPTNIESTMDPMAYAQTGLPLFISALLERGARKPTLEACVAGGALIGPLCRRDLVLDIGGRTADVVERILKREGIPISKIEVGGTLGYRLSLNSSDWETSIEPVWGSPIPGMDKRVYEKPDLDDLWKWTERLSPVPQTALKIIRMIGDPASNIRDISSEIIKDQVLSAKTIRFCNSVIFGQCRRIDSLERGLAILGDKRLIQFVLSASLEDFISQNETGYSLCKGAMFKHSVGTALASAKVAELSGQVPADVAYTAGLLHDIGKVVLDQFMAAAHPLFYRSLRAEGSNIIEIERELFGISHAEAGLHLATDWGLPDTIKDVIGFHHAPETAGSNQELIHTVYLADLVMSRFMTGLEIEKLEHGFNPLKSQCHKMQDWRISKSTGEGLARDFRVQLTTRS